LKTLLVSLVVEVLPCFCSRKERNLGTDDTRAKLHPHVAACVVRHDKADIELASGRMSDFYFDGRVATLTGE
jgi:hypothetical protein